MIKDKIVSIEIEEGVDGRDYYVHIFNEDDDHNPIATATVEITGSGAHEASLRWGRLGANDSRHETVWSKGAVIGALFDGMLS